jgi:hypothetical protein
MMTDELVIDNEVSVTIDRRYPIGHFSFDDVISDEDMQRMIQTIEEFPSRLKNLISTYGEDQLGTPYREEGWTIRQVVHHVADSHMNAYIRFKLALTEDKPTIKPYNEKAWAEMIDSKELPVSVSLNLLDSLHKRWSHILRAMQPEDFQKTFFHPEHMKLHHLKEFLAMYAWHCNHHYAHIQLIEPKQQAAKSTRARIKKPVAKKRTSGKQ